MKAEWWIDGAPKRFEVGMLVRTYEDGVGLVCLVEMDSTLMILQDGTAHQRHVLDGDCCAHCPMMPRREAEDMARRAWLDGADTGGDGTGWPEDFEEWLEQERERRAGTFGNEARDIEDLEPATKLVTLDAAVAIARQMAERGFLSGWKWRSREDPSVCDPSLEAMVAKCGDEAALDAEAKL